MSTTTTTTTTSIESPVHQHPSPVVPTVVALAARRPRLSRGRRDRSSRRRTGRFGVGCRPRRCRDRRRDRRRPMGAAAPPRRQYRLDSGNRRRARRGTGRRSRTRLVPHRHHVAGGHGCGVGLGVGLAQGAMLGNTKRMLGWRRTAALWAVGWSVTTAGGISVDSSSSCSAPTAPSPRPSCRASSSARSFRPRRCSHDRRRDARRVRHRPAGRAVATSSTRAPEFAWSTEPAPRSSPAWRRSAVTPPTSTSPATWPPTPTPCTSASTPNYHRWAEEFPPLQRAVLGAATSADAKLVVLENLYMYGPSTGRSVRPPRSTRRARRAGPAPPCPLSSSTHTSAVRSASSSVEPRTSSAPACDSALGQFVFQPRWPASGPRRWDDPTPSTPTATSPTSAATSSCSARATTPTAGCGTPRTPRPAHPADHHRRVRRAGSAAPTSPPSSGRCCERSGCSTATSVSSAHLLPVRRAVRRRRLGVPPRVRRPHDELGRHRRQHRRLVPPTPHNLDFSPVSQRPQPEGDPMSSLASLVVRRRRAVITIWIVLLGAGTVGSSAFSVLSSSFGAGPSTESAAPPSGSTTSPEPAARSPSSPTASTSTTRRRRIPGCGLRAAAIDGVIAVADPWSTGRCPSRQRRSRCSPSSPSPAASTRSRSRSRP